MGEKGSNATRRIPIGAELRHLPQWCRHPLWHHQRIAPPSAPAQRIKGPIMAWTWPPGVIVGQMACGEEGSGAEAHNGIQLGGSRELCEATGPDPYPRAKRDHLT